MNERDLERFDQRFEQLESRFDWFLENCIDEDKEQLDVEKSTFLEELDNHEQEARDHFDERNERRRRIYNLRRRFRRLLRIMTVVTRYRKLNDVFLGLD